MSVGAILVPFGLMGLVIGVLLAVLVPVFAVSRWMRAMRL